MDLVGDLEGFDGLTLCEDGRDFPLQLFFEIVLSKSGELNPSLKLGVYGFLNKGQWGPIICGPVKMECL